jgi:predicted metal-dependent peptidase
MTDIAKRISKAKTSLILEHPFIGSIAVNMPTIISTGVPTAATNGKRIIFNPDFLADLCDEQVKFLVAHECMHPMLEHNYRRQGRDPLKWNKAADYVINQLLTEEHIGKFIDGGCLNATLYNAGKGTSEGIYNILPEDNGDGNGGGIGGTGADLEDGEGSPAEQAQEAAEWRVKVAQAAQAAKMMGKMSVTMQRLVDEVLQPKVDWRDVLRRFMQKAKTETRSFARPNRRFLAQGLYLPTMSGETLGEVALAIDCSGSIGARELNEFAAEVRAIHEDLRPSKMHVVYFDSEVSKFETFGPEDALTIGTDKTGGTAFSPIFRKLSEEGVEPVACVVLTDLCCNDFGPQPDYPVLWVSNHSDKAPWGEVVKV